MNLLFDLDGTISDPAEGILNSIQYAFTHLNKPAPERHVLLRFIGPPLIDSFKETAGFTEEETHRAVALYREYFNIKGKYENFLYPEIRDVLEAAVKMRHRLFIATSKPTVFAKEIIAHFHLADYFIEVAGSNLDHTRREKAEIINHLLHTYQLNTKDTWMIGDRLHDVAGARKCGVKSVGVNWGYAESGEWLAYSPDLIVENPAELLALIQRLS
ncbi:MAG: HAD-IA family hydrolase [Bacteroidetes bacterium]|nr:HAD-IA family hydrolase [Bacteroidota bacterium]